MKLPMHLALLVVAILSAPLPAPTALTATDASQSPGGILTSDSSNPMRVGNEPVFLANNGRTALIEKAEPRRSARIDAASKVTLNQQVDAQTLGARGN